MTELCWDDLQVTASHRETMTENVQFTSLNVTDTAVATPNQRAIKRLVNQSKDSEQRKKQKRQGATQFTATSSRLACPFFLWDREKHLSCLHFQLRRVKDVKQHISRKHACAQSSQRGSGLTKDHKRGTTAFFCHKESGLTAESCHGSLSKDQIQQLSQRTADGSKLEEEDQWYKIWDILFPDSPRNERPKTPYLQSDVQEIITTVRQVWLNNGAAALQRASTPTKDHINNRDEGPGMLHQVDKLLEHLSIVSQTHPMGPLTGMET